jgi:predicted FMN-binding regulatory protein PaiB
MASNWNWRASTRCASVHAAHSGCAASISSSWFMMPRK